MRVFVSILGREPDYREQLVDSFLLLAGRELLEVPQRLRDYIKHALYGIERRIRVLKDHLNAFPVSRLVLADIFSNILALEFNCSARKLRKSDYGFAHRALA
jgi:hypothetical protein